MYLCPYCGEEINQSSELCPHCSADLTLEGEPAAPAPPRPLRKILLRWGLIIAFVAAGLWGFLWFVLPEQHGDPAMRAESGAIAAMGDLRAALARYSVAQPDRTYPSSLEQLGDAARADAQLALSVGYQLSYTPELAPDGAIRGYALQARAGNYGFKNFYLDQTGAVHATRENRAANSQDPVL